MKLKLKRGTSGKLLRVYLQDATRSDGGPLLGLTSGTPGLVWNYLREGDATPTDVTLVSGTVGTWASGSLKEVDAARMPGLYELGCPNAALASGQSVLLMLHGVTNLLPCLIEIELDGVDYEDTVRFGLSSLPNAAQGQPGSLPTGNATGQVTLDMTQAVPITNTPQTVGDALNASRAEGFGNWTLLGSRLTLFAPDGVTAVHVFTLDNPTSPTSRT